MAIPVAAAAPSYFFAPAGGWHMGGIIYALDFGYLIPKTMVFESSCQFPIDEICKIFRVPVHLVRGRDATAKFIMAANPDLPLKLLPGDFERYMKFGHQTVLQRGNAPRVLNPISNNQNLVGR